MGERNGSAGGGPADGAHPTFCFPTEPEQDADDPFAKTATLEIGHARSGSQRGSRSGSLGQNNRPSRPSIKGRLRQLPQGGGYSRRSLVATGGIFAEEELSAAQQQQRRLVRKQQRRATEQQPARSPEQLKELQSLFEEFDEDGSGMVSADELKQILPRLGAGTMPDEQIEQLVSELDVDGDGGVSFQEFLLFCDVLLAQAGPGSGGQARDLMSALAAPSGALGLIEAVKERKEQLAKDAYMTERQMRTRARLHDMLYGLPSFAPDFVYRRWWDVLVLAVILYVWIVASVQIVKGVTPTPPLLAVDVFVTIVFAVDILVVLNTAVQPSRRRHDLEVDRRKIFMHYARSGALCVDVVSAIPLDITIGILSGSTRAWRLLRSLRVLKLFKFPHLFCMTDRGTMDASFVRFYFWTTTLLRQLFLILVSLHLLTLLRMLISMAAEKDSTAEGKAECPEFGKERCTDSILEQYLYAFFWVWALLTTQGMVALEDELSYAYAALCAVFSVVLQGHVVANMSALVLKSNVEVQNQDAMRSTLAIMSHYNIPLSLQQEVLSFQYHSLQQNAAASLAQILERLPTTMQCEVGLYVKVDLVASVPMFNDISTEARLAVANCLDQTYAEPEDYIIQYGDIGAEMFFMMHGFADVIIPASFADASAVITEGRIVATIKRGDFFGEVALLQPEQTRTASIQALTYCDLFCLAVQDFVDLFDQFSELSDQVQSEARKRGIIKDDLPPEAPGRGDRGSAVSHATAVQLFDCGDGVTAGLPALPLGARQQLIHRKSKATTLTVRSSRSASTARGSVASRGSRARPSAVSFPDPEPSTPNRGGRSPRNSGRRSPRARRSLRPDKAADDPAEAAPHNGAGAALPPVAPGALCTQVVPEDVPIPPSPSSQDGHPLPPSPPSPSPGAEPVSPPPRHPAQLPPAMHSAAHLPPERAPPERRSSTDADAAPGPLAAERAVSAASISQVPLHPLLSDVAAPLGSAAPADAAALPEPAELHRPATPENTPPDKQLLCVASALLPIGLTGPSEVSSDAPMHPAAVDLRPTLDAIEQRVELRVRAQVDRSLRQLREDSRGLGVRLDEIEHALVESLEAMEHRLKHGTEDHAGGGLFAAAGGGGGGGRRTSVRWK